MTTTPKLTPYQSDLLLDVLEDCRNVRDLYRLKEQAEAAAGSADQTAEQQAAADKDVAEATSQYDAVVEQAADRYGEAAMYVPNEVLERVANKYLPPHLMIDSPANEPEPEPQHNSD